MKRNVIVTAAVAAAEAAVLWIRADVRSIHLLLLYVLAVVKLLFSSKRFERPLSLRGS